MLELHCPRETSLAEKHVSAWFRQRAGYGTLVAHLHYLSPNSWEEGESHGRYHRQGEREHRQGGRQGQGMGRRGRRQSQRGRPQSRRQDEGSGRKDPRKRRVIASPSGFLSLCGNFGNEVRRTISSSPHVT